MLLFLLLSEVYHQQTGKQSQWSSPLTWLQKAESLESGEAQEEVFQECFTLDDNLASSLS